jgi:hypothetical protein
VRNAVPSISDQPWSIFSRIKIWKARFETSHDESEVRRKAIIFFEGTKYISSAAVRFASTVVVDRSTTAIFSAHEKVDKIL